MERQLRASLLRRIADIGVENIFNFNKNLETMSLSSAEKAELLISMMQANTRWRQFLQEIFGTSEEEFLQFILQNYP